MDLLVINGTAMPPPTAFSVERADLDADNSGRSETGVMQRQRGRADVAKISVGWSNLSEGEMAAVCGSIAAERFPVIYWFGGANSATMYAGDRTCRLKSVGAKAETYWDMDVDLIEY